MYKSGSDSLQLLEQVVTWLAEKFLLRCPSESTMACLAAFTIMRDSEESQRRTLRTPDILLATTKAQVSSVLAKHRFNKVQEHQYVTKLPLDLSKLPPHLEDHGKLCAPPEVKLSDLLMTARKIPLRSRKKVSKHEMGNLDGGNATNALNTLSGLVGLMHILHQGQPSQPHGLNLEYLQPQPTKKNGGALQSLLYRDAAASQASSASAPAQQLAIADVQSGLPSSSNAVRSAPTQVAAPATMLDSKVPCNNPFRPF